uniref:Putative group i salivary lipocalin n=1 Tax=Rhipicephalus pulchellus TaxID=72859 RepID=L7LSQ3_RHIPC
MRGKQLCAALLVALYFTVGKCMPEVFGGRKFNMRKFLSTRVPIWTFYTTFGGNAECEVELVREINSTSVSFKRYFYEGQKKMTSTLLGKLDYRRKDRMIIQTAGGYLLEEVIVYADKLYSCAVIKFTTTFCDHAHTYDLLVWNSSITSGPDRRCIKEYVKREPRGRMVYRPQCQNILKIRGEFQQPTIRAGKCPR